MAYGENVATAAEFINEFWFPAHRGCLQAREHFVLFGNDGYAEDTKAKREVELVTNELDRLGRTTRAFATSADGYTWVIVVDDRSWVCDKPLQGDQATFHRIVWNAWEQACNEQAAAQGAA